MRIAYATDSLTLSLRQLNPDFAIALDQSSRIRTALCLPTRIGELTIDFVTPSIGIILFPEHADSQEAPIKAADSALRQAKRQHDCAGLCQPEALSSASQTR